MNDSKNRTQVLDSLQTAYDGSWYTIAGAGGDLTEWVEGYEKILAETKVGTPTAWYRTTGVAVNEFATRPAGHGVRENALFRNDLTLLLFPLDGLDVGRLALLKIKAQDRWFDDVIDNMRSGF